MMNDHDNDEGGSSHFIQKAIKHPGALRRKAAAAGQSTMQFAESHDSGDSQTAKQSRFAEFLARVRRRSH